MHYPSFSLLKMSAAPPAAPATTATHRLTTLLAHIDHGKTSFSDSLLPSLPTKSFGTARLLDSTPEERRRGITIRLSIRKRK